MADNAEARLVPERALESLIEEAALGMTRAGVGAALAAAGPGRVDEVLGRTRAEVEARVAWEDEEECFFAEPPTDEHRAELARLLAVGEAYRQRQASLQP